MPILLQVIKNELLLIMRSKFTYFIAPIVIIFGILQATSIRAFPTMMWGATLSNHSRVSLILVFWTLGQGLRKQDKQLGKIIWTTITPSWIYILGKFLGIFSVALGFSLLFELVAILTDQLWNNHGFSLIFQGIDFLPDAVFPPLGWTAFLVFWLYFALVPALFGVALSIGSNYLTRGKRLIGYTAALLCWMLGIHLPSWMDITSLSLLFDNDPVMELFRQLIPITQAYYTDHVLLQPQTTQLMDAIRATIPPYFLGWPFLVNRLLFFLLSILLVWITIVVVERRRTTGG